MITVNGEPTPEDIVRARPEKGGADNEVVAAAQRAKVRLTEEITSTIDRKLAGDYSDAIMILATQVIDGGDPPPEPKPKPSIWPKWLRPSEPSFRSVRGGSYSEVKSMPYVELREIVAWPIKGTSPEHHLGRDGNIYVAVEDDDDWCLSEYPECRMTEIDSVIHKYGVYSPSEKEVDLTSYIKRLRKL